MIVYQCFNIITGTILPIGSRSLPIGSRSLPIGSRSLPIGSRSLPIGRNSNFYGNSSNKSHFEATCRQSIAPIVAAARCLVSVMGMQRLQRIAGLDMIREPAIGSLKKL
ncbi:MAG: hypothetical protein WCL14_10640 [Bacteroidota bacterium]